MNGVLIECRFDQNKCSSSDFHIFKDPFNLTCYRFNSAKNSFSQSMKIKDSKQSGLNSNLVVMFNTSKSSHLDLFESKIHAFVNNASSLFMPIRPYYQDNPITLIKGGHLIQIEREFVKKLSKPHKNCIKQENTEFASEIFEYFIRNNITYLQKNCLICAFGKKLNKHVIALIF